MINSAKDSKHEHFPVQQFLVVTSRKQNAMFYLYRDRFASVRVHTPAWGIVASTG
jgi:hypothetical protein